MRIAWVTPCAERSAIARVSHEVAWELRWRGLEIEIFRSELGEAALLPVPKSYGGAKELPAAEELKAAFDMIVVTIGDHYGFNGGCLRVLRSISCVAIFHDADLQGLVWGLLQEDQLDPKGLDRLRLGVADSKYDGTFGADLGWVATLCLGAVVHARHYLEPVAAGCPGLTALMPLCLRDQGLPLRARSPSEFTILTYGWLNANKQADRVLRAIALSPRLRSNAVFHLAGPVEDTERVRLLALAEEVGVRPPTFFGWVPNDELQRLLGGAHVVCCLRYPILEGGSASVIQSLYSGNPIVVADAGSYAEIPDEFVYKVSYGTDAEDVMQALETVAEDQDKADHRAEKARIWARENYSIERYVDNLLPLLERSLSLAPIIDAGRALGAALSDLNPGLDEPALSRLAGALQELVGPADRVP